MIVNVLQNSLVCYYAGGKRIKNNKKFILPQKR